MGVTDGYIYDFAFYTPVPGGIKQSRFAIDASEVLGDDCRVLFVNDTTDPSRTLMFALPRRRLMEMVKMMANKEGLL